MKRHHAPNACLGLAPSTLHYLYGNASSAILADSNLHHATTRLQRCLFERSARYDHSILRYPIRQRGITVEYDGETYDLFQRIFNAPSDAYIQSLNPSQYPLFIHYLFERDGLYRPVYVDGPGDGGVDIELHARDGRQPELIGVVQCKRYTNHNVKPDEMIVFANAARKSHAQRRYYFTTHGFMPGARKEARENGISLYDPLGIRSWIQDIHRRELNSRKIDELPHPDQISIPVICVTNNKGGVGKTTITGNLAAALTTEQQGVLVIDGDPQGHLTFWLTNQKRVDPGFSLHAVLTNNYPIHALVRPTLEPGVWILPSSRELVDLPAGYDSYTLERRLAHALAAMPLADPPIRCVLIDTPPALSVLTRAALIASGSLLIPLQLDVFSEEGLSELLTFLEKVEALHKRRPMQVLGGVATMVDQRFLLGQNYLKRFPKTALSHQRLVAAGITPSTFWCGVIRQRVDFKKALAERKTVLNLAPHSDAAKDVRQLAKEVIARVPALHHDPAPTGQQ